MRTRGKGSIQRASRALVVLVVAGLVLVACSSESIPPDAFGNTIPRPTDVDLVDFDALDRGETIDVDWIVPCSFQGIAPSRDERYLIDKNLAEASAPDGYRRGDFPDDLDVYIYNEGASDGSPFAILNVKLRRVDRDTIEMLTKDGELLANFVRDTTDPNTWGFCG